MSRRVRAESSSGPPRRSDRREAGYAYILALMLIAALMIAALAAMQNGLAQAKRRQEELTIWRGEQYVRAIRQYYKKANHYPQTIEDLQKGIGGVHFLRPSAYLNPMNRADGSWRLIYVNPAGQLIGSTRYANLQQMALIVLNNGKMPAATTGGVPGLSSSSGPAGSAGGTPNESEAGDSDNVGNNDQNSSGSNEEPGANSGGTAGNGGATSNNEGGNENQQGQGNSGNESSGGNPGETQNQPGAANSSSQQPGSNSLGLGQSGQGGILSGTNQGVNPILLMKPTGPVSGPVVGGFLTGVALSSEAKSQKVYEGGKKYINWEFIWNPLVDQARALAAGQGMGATGAVGGANGNNGNGFGFGGILGGQQQGQQQQPNGQQPPQQQIPQ
ncbi:MAG TPA: hypothetical protein VJR23_14910 [Candidatus Acidoferrales bacterium]|nr:hypothetical protein [Candidatus Acidoferrales bacterium]